jgi:hypothetical protein
MSASSASWWLRTTPMASLRLRLENDERVPLREDQQEEIRKLLRGDDYNEAWLHHLSRLPFQSDACCRSGSAVRLRRQSRVLLGHTPPPS